MSIIISIAAIIITAPKAPMVNAIERAKRNENACSRVAKIPASSHNLMDVSLYRINEMVANVNGTMNIRFSPMVRRRATFKTSIRASAPYNTLFA